MTGRLSSLKKKKGKAKIAVISVLSMLLPVIMGGAAIDAGFTAIGNFFTGIVDFVGDVVGAPVKIAVSAAEAFTTLVDGDVTEDDAESWGVDKATMLYLLEQVAEYNGREPRQLTCETECEITWEELVPELEEEDDGEDESLADETEPSDEGTAAGETTEEPEQEKEPVYELKTETAYVDMVVREDGTIIEKYQVDWTLVYLMASYYVMDNKIDREAARQEGKPCLSNEVIDEIIEDFKPVFVYEFDPFSTWEEGESLSMATVKAHPHTVNRQTVIDSTLTNYKDNKYYLLFYSPRLVLNKVIMPWREDTYTKNSRGEYVVTRKYDVTKLREIFAKYAKEREFELVLDALSLAPGSDALLGEIRIAMAAEETNGK